MYVCISRGNTSKEFACLRHLRAEKLSTLWTHKSVCLFQEEGKLGFWRVEDRMDMGQVDNNPSPCVWIVAPVVKYLGERLQQSAPWWIRTWWLIYDVWFWVVECLY